MSRPRLQPLRLASRPSQPGGRAHERGAATLVVVMVLFFIVALVAAYTSRNLIFEQRTSANQYRSTQAFEAAEAGLEWALAMLNSGRVDAACQPHPLAADKSFRDRYLDIDVDTGRVTAPPRAGAEPRRAACVFDGAGWQCRCPADADPALVDPAGPGPFPAFVLRFFDVSTDAPPVAYPPGVVRIESTGCTRLDAAGICATSAASGDGRATVTVLAALKSALVASPTAAVTTHGDLKRVDTATLEAVNENDAAGGVTVHAGRTIQSPNNAWLRPRSLPGTPGDQSFFQGDALMFGLNAERMFSAVFGMGRNTYRLQPAAVFVNCVVDCTAATVRDMARLNPGRVLWVDGNLAIDIADPIGTNDLPVMLVVNGSIAVSSPDAKLTGVVYTTGTSWANTGSLTLNGAAIGEADLTLSGNGTTKVSYAPEVLNRLHKTSGSFVRVPGSWRDF